jgi:hypothetical protein
MAANAAEIRASDQERDLAAARLREHAASGRLSMEELTGRLEATLTAQTRGKLEAQFHDLPAETQSAPARRESTGPSAHTRIYLAVSLLMIAIWAATGMGYFWPMWPMFGWGIGVVLSHRASKSVPCAAGRRRASSPCPNRASASAG